MFDDFSGTVFPILMVIYGAALIVTFPIAYKRIKRMSKTTNMYRMFYRRYRDNKSGYAGLVKFNKNYLYEYINSNTAEIEIDNETFYEIKNIIDFIIVDKLIKIQEVSELGETVSESKHES